MKAIDLTKFIEGLLVVLVTAIALGNMGTSACSPHVRLPNRSTAGEPMPFSRRPIAESVLIRGGGRAYKVEHQGLCVSLKRLVSWARNSVDLAVLAKLRQVDQLNLDEIAERMGISRSTVGRGMRSIRNRGRCRSWT